MDGRHSRRQSSAEAPRHLSDVQTTQTLLQKGTDDRCGASVGSRRATARGVSPGRFFDRSWQRIDVLEVEGSREPDRVKRSRNRHRDRDFSQRNVVNVLNVPPHVAHQSWPLCPSRLTVSQETQRPSRPLPQRSVPWTTQAHHSLALSCTGP